MPFFELSPEEKVAVQQVFTNKAFLEVAPNLSPDAIGFLSRTIVQVSAGELDVDDTLLAVLDSLIPGAEEAIRIREQQLNPGNTQNQFTHEYVLATFGRIRIL